LKLKDKTYKKFVDFFEKISKKYDDTEFEIAYSEIQRETGVASITLKKALQILENDGIILVNQGRNTRYGKFKYLLNNKEIGAKDPVNLKLRDYGDTGEVNNPQLEQQLKTMSGVIEQLRQRVRTQEMTISVILDRLAEVEDRLHK
jgi:DNA-binding HxlR family transcriptional regulator